MNTYGLIICTTPDGWSLHAPNSTDEEIANGESPYLLCGEGEPTQADYDAANKKVATLQGPQTSDLTELYDTIADGLQGNARINSVPLSEGWSAETAIDTYLTETQVTALSADEYEVLHARVTELLEKSTV